MKGSEKAAPNDRDKSRYGENRQVRTSADARKWKRMIEYVTISLLVPAAFARNGCLVLFRGQNWAFCPFATKKVQCQNWTAHHQLCIPLHAEMCLNVSYMCFVDGLVCVCRLLLMSHGGCPIGREGVAWGGRRPRRRTRRDPHGGVGGEPAMGQDSKSAP